MSTSIEEVTNEGRWICGCACGNVIRQRNLAYTSSRPSCEACQPIIDGRDEMFGPPSVSHELGWCGCGNPERVDELMLRFLSAVPRWEHPDVDIPADERLLLGYIADAAGWTEHGTSIGGAWLTSDGQAVLDRLRQLTERTR